MIFPPVGKAAEVTKCSAILTPVLCATRSAVAIIKETAVGTPIPPEGAPADSRLSADVFTVIPVALPAVAAPIVRPLRVMVKAVPAGMLENAVVMTIEVAPGADTCPVMVATDASPATKKYEAVAAKNPDG